MVDEIQCGRISVPPAHIIDALENLVSDERRDKMKRVLDARLCSIALGVEDLANSFNGAACLRTAESLGIQDVVAAELRHEYPMPELPKNPVTSGVNMYAHRWVELHRVPSSAHLIQWAQKRQMSILGTSPHARKTISDIDIERPLLVLFGNERDGIRDETAAACDQVFRLPMYGFTESFNVTVSVAMTLSNLVTRRRDRLARDGEEGDLPEARKEYLLAKWYLSTVRRSDLIVERYVKSRL
ncbi:MAG: RNA methyltransferase [Myxococcota bacterium]|nr:RNA methyltransferase [Myxococcota bacterium]